MSYRHYQYPLLSCHQMEATLGMEAKPEPMSVMERQKLLEKLNLDGLAHWSPRNAVVARELVLAYHNVFTLESNELGCTSAIEHKICIDTSEPCKEWFRCIPPHLLEEVHVSLQHGTLHFCVDFTHLNMWTKKDSYLLPHI